MHSIYGRALATDGRGATIRCAPLHGSQDEREVFACLGAVFIGGTAWTRLTVFTKTRPVEPGSAIIDSPQPVLTAATREGWIFSPSSLNRLA
jgi:hypothetical protein